MKYFFNIIILILWLLPGQLDGQGNFALGGLPSHLGLGRATVAAQGMQGIFNNQAGLTSLNGYGFAATALRRYNISGLDIFSVGGYYSKGLNAFSLNVIQYGTEDYREQKIGFAYARRLADKLSIGLQFNYISLNQAEFGSTGNITAEIGILSNVTKDISIGVHVFSPWNVEISPDYAIPTQFRLGPRFDISSSLSVYLEVEKTIDRDPNLKSGIDYDWNDDFSVQIGVIPSVSEYALSFQYTFGSYGLQGGFSYDELLDVSPSFGFLYQSE